jgi:hypothetical protein
MLEQRFTTIDAAADEAAKYTRDLGTIVKGLRKASRTGDLNQVHRHLAELNDRLEDLGNISKKVKTEEFDEEGYLASEAYLDEISEAAGVAGVRVIKGADCLFSYPTTVRVNAQKKCLIIGKRRDARLRPQVVVQELKRLQNEAGRITEAAFLEVLFSAYRVLTNSINSSIDRIGAVVPLSQVYSLLTLLPQASKDYSLSDFGMDVYRLDRSRLQRTRDGAVLSLPASTGTRGSSGIFSVISESGEEIRYFAVSFRVASTGEQSDDTTVA